MRIQKLALMPALLFCFHAFAGSENVLVIGDSHTCGAFGSTLVNDISKTGATVDAFCGDSSSAENWVRGTTPPHYNCEAWTNNGKPKPCDVTVKGKIPSLKTILGKKRYDKVVFALGTNSLLSPTADRYYADLAQEAGADGRSCSWIGPPHVRSDEAKGFAPSRIEKEDQNVDSFYTSLDPSLGRKTTTKSKTTRQTVSNFCNVVDSRPATAATNKVGGKTVDGVHRGTSGGAYWANQVVAGVDKPPTANALCNTVNKAQMTASGQACLNP